MAIHVIFLYYLHYLCTFVFILTCNLLIQVITGLLFFITCNLLLICYYISLSELLSNKLLLHFGLVYQLVPTTLSVFVGYVQSPCSLFDGNIFLKPFNCIHYVLNINTFLTWHRGFLQGFAKTKINNSNNNK